MVTELDKQIAEYCAERDKMLRSLNIDEFDKFYKKHKLLTPKGGKWLDPIVPFIMMHKARLQIESMTEEEKKVSREWLLSRGYQLPLGVI